MLQNGSKLQSVEQEERGRIINYSYDLWISNISIHQSKPRLRVTNTGDNTQSRENNKPHFMNVLTFHNK
jgi:hypothetical protein